jgi:hypothetical protein
MLKEVPPFAKRHAQLMMVLPIHFIPHQDTAPVVGSLRDSHPPRDFISRQAVIRACRKLPA